MYAAIPEKAASFINSQRIFPILRYKTFYTIEIKYQNFWEYGIGQN